MYLRLLLVVGLLALAAPSVGLADLSDKYPGPWQDDYHTQISQTLAANDITGCGQYKYKEEVDGNGYVVYCTRDGSTWRAYVVWAAVGKVMGPLAPDPSLN